MNNQDNEIMEEVFLQEQIELQMAIEEKREEELKYLSRLTKEEKLDYFKNQLAENVQYIEALNLNTIDENGEIDD